jgi:alpha-beta hydrolase superfamily lysophospholipase
MMKAGNTLITADNQTLTWYQWISEDPQAKPLVIVHGMAEHAQRYDDFARYLNGQGFHVYAMDLRGHGQSIQEGRLGHFADRHGWFAVVEDIAAFVNMVTSQHQQTPALLGHSMGSLLLRSYCIEYEDPTRTKVILSGSSRGLAPLVMKAAKGLAHAVRATKKPWAPSPFMDKLIFGAYAKSIPNPRTPFDWLTRDENVVDAYIQDPLCGFVCSSQFYVDLVDGLIHCNDPTNLNRMKNKQDLLFLSGSDDPVGNMGKDLSWFQTFFTGTDQNVSSQCILYPQYRHEILNEIGKEQVYQDVVTFLNR